LKKKQITVKKVIQWYQQYQRLSIKKRKVFGILVILIPISLWTSVSIDLGVIFDNNPRLLWVNVPTTAKIN
jgi:hypothetical protein